jgi:choline dehydrogenase-like flavoprotein
MEVGPEYDAVVVGSGAAGGWAVKELAERGLRTLLLEAGRALDPVHDFTPPAASVSRIRLLSRARAVLGSQPVQARCMSYGPLTRHLFVDDRKNPYRTLPGTRFNWYRGRQVGGRLHLWGRNALRIADHELHPALVDGVGDNWPIAYRDLEPWYERVERFLGVQGEAAGIPNIPDGCYAGPHPLTEAELQVLRTLAKRWPDRPATTCRIIRHSTERVPLPIRAALATGNLTLRSDAVVSHVVTDPESGIARGVTFRDRRTGETHEVRTRAVVLCASTIESIRIMLNSATERHPNGLGNSSGRLGRFLTDHVMVFQAGPHEPLEPQNKGDPYDFGTQSGIYLPSFRNTGSRQEEAFRRGYALLGSVGRIEPGWFFMAIGEMLPRFENHVALDRRKRDAWGVPVARIRCTHSDNERAMIRDMQATLRELTAVCGLRTSPLERESFVSRMVYRLASPLVYTREGALVPGSAVHESGGAGMGSDPRSSVLNAHNQCWDSPNVLVTDGAAFTTSPFQNPGLTIMALSARAGNFVADEVKAGRF